MRTFVRTIATITATPKIVVPFLWRSEVTGNVYLRIRDTAAGPRDLHLAYGDKVYATNIGHGELINVLETDVKAWGLRLKDEEVVITND